MLPLKLGRAWRGDRYLLVRKSGSRLHRTENTWKTMLCLDLIKRPASIASKKTFIRRLSFNSVERAQTALNGNLFTESQHNLLNKEIDFLRKFGTQLESMKASPGDLAELKKSIECLRDMFLLVVVGEFNSGKTSFLNALLGRSLLPEGVTPTTSQVNILRFGSQVSRRDDASVSGLASQNAHVEIYLPVPWLKYFSLVDTPGTNAVIKLHQEITEHFVPRSDMVLFVTSVDRAFTESERAFLEKIREYNKKLVVILSKIDILLDFDKELKQICDFVTDQIKHSFGITPRVFPISSRLALRAKSLLPDNLSWEEQEAWLNKNEEWRRSRFGDIETYILTTLDANERGKLKLENPLGMVKHFIAKYELEINIRMQFAQEDLRTLEKIDQELDAFVNDIMKEYAHYEYQVDKVFLDMLDRAKKFFNHKLVLTNAWNLTNSDQLKAEFEHSVVSDPVAQIQKYIYEMVDWIIERQAKQWEIIIQYIMARQQFSRPPSTGTPLSMLGSIGEVYQQHRSQLIADFSERTKTIINSFDKNSEATRISSEIKLAVYRTLAFEIGVLGLGTWLTASLMDVTGMLGIGFLAAAGTVLLPYKKRQLSNQFSSQILKVQTKLKVTLKKQFESELYQRKGQILDNLSPYRKFVHDELAGVELAKSNLGASKKELIHLEKQIQAEFSN